MLICVILKGNFSSFWENAKRAQVYFVHNNIKHGEKVENPTIKHWKAWYLLVTWLKCEIKLENKRMCKNTRDRDMLFKNWFVKKP